MCNECKHLYLFPWPNTWNWIFISSAVCLKFISDWLLRHLGIACVGATDGADGWEKCLRSSKFATNQSHFQGVKKKREPKHQFVTIFFLAKRSCSAHLWKPVWIKCSCGTSRFVHQPGVTDRTTTGFSLPATKPKPKTGSRLISTRRGAGGLPSRWTSSRELLWDPWLENARWKKKNW